jgi:ribosomal protein S18 acetylase RimI-like enzyme
MELLPVALQSPDAKIRIRPARLADVEALHAYCWHERPYAALYNLVSRATYLARDGRGLGVVVSGGEGLPNHMILGYGQMTMWPDCAEISDLVVAEAFRSRGIGTTVIQYLVRAAREMHADQIEIGASLNNPRAIALYRRIGFKDNHTTLVSAPLGRDTVLYLRLMLQKVKHDEP